MANKNEDYIPTPAQAFPAMRIVKYICPKCGHMCKPDEMNVLLEGACPKCFILVIKQLVPMMKPLTEAIPVDSSSKRGQALIKKADELNEETTKIMRKDEFPNWKRPEQK